MFITSVMTNTLLQLILAIASFMIIDLPGEKPARYAFRVGLVAYFFCMLLTYVRLQFFADSPSAQKLTFILISWSVGIFLGGISVGFGWRSHHDNIYGVAVFAVACHMLLSFYVLHDIQFRTTLYTISGCLTMAYISYCTIMRKPKTNIADKLIALVAIAILFGIAYKQYALTEIIIDNPETNRYDWIILSPALMAAISLFTFGSYMSDMVAALTAQATRDPLTNLFNRRYLAERATEIFSYAHRHSYPVSLIMLDIDKFKVVNDLYGHDAGDQALIMVAKILLNSSRKEDLVVRLGGEEFVLMLQNMSGLAALELAENLRLKIEKSVCHVGNIDFSFTASFGVFTNENGLMTLEEMLSITDKLLYEAKHNGRNTVVANSPKS